MSTAYLSDMIYPNVKGENNDLFLKIEFLEERYNDPLIVYRGGYFCRGNALKLLEIGVIIFFEFILKIKSKCFLAGDIETAESDLKFFLSWNISSM